jgi:8-oxo-dGTP pyrophosphatase MutT (NUDIX family)
VWGRRGGAPALEVLLVQRNPQARFMGGVWVFPGGAVEPEEQTAEHPYELAARRELREEAGIELAADAELVQFSRWITPALVETRYDTVFFLAQLPADQEARVDGNECVAHRWLTPEHALAQYSAGELSLVFPTIKHLQQLAPFTSAAEPIERSRGKQIGPVQPKVIVESGTPRVVLPGEPGY